MKKLHSLCPLRWAVLLLSWGWLAFYFLRRSDRALMERLCESVVRPWHRLAARLYDALPFSAAEIYIALGVALGLGFLAAGVVWLCRRGKDRRQLYRGVLTFAALLSALFALFCLWWGVYYYAGSFAEHSALVDAPVSVEALETVTDYFVLRANESAQQVARGEDGLYAGDADAIFDSSRTLYRNIAALYPQLSGPEVRAKPLFFSRALSALTTTGFFFPYTAEANINVDAPLCLVPATIAHEQAHQRGVSAEDEANFVGILACWESGEADYIYSAALLGYIYLGNALQKADYAAWETAYHGLSPEARADLAAYNAYWQHFETPVSKTSDEVYEVFLRTYGDERGMESYGACVDLLVAYYYEEAAAAVG